MNKSFNDPAFTNNLLFLIAIVTTIYAINKERKKQGLQWHQIGKLIENEKLNIGKIFLAIVVIFTLMFIIIQVASLRRY